MKTQLLEKTLEGIEGSRRVGWAMYYKKCEEVDELKWITRLMCEKVIHNKRLRNDDPLVQLAEEMLKSIH